MNYKNIPAGSKVKYNNRKGITIEKPRYESGGNWGFWFVKVKWDDGQIEDFNICRIGFEVIE